MAHNPLYQGNLVRVLWSTLLSLSIAVLAIGCAPAEYVPKYNCETMPEHLKNLPTTTEYMFVVWRPAAQSMESFRTDVLYSPVGGGTDNSLEGLLTGQSSVLRFSELAEEFNLFNEVPQSRPDGSNVSVIIYMAIANDAAAEAIEAQITANVHYVATYKVERAIPLDYVRTWPDGQYSPGLQLVTLLERKTGLADQEFYDLWHCGDTPLALEIHPFWRYERNVVTASLTPDAPYLDGIVTLHAQTDVEITDIFLFLSNDLGNGLVVQSSISTFLNVDTLESNAMREYFVESEFTP